MTFALADDLVWEFAFSALRALDLEFKGGPHAQETPKSRGKTARTST